MNCERMTTPIAWMAWGAAELGLSPRGFWKSFAEISHPQDGNPKTNNSNNNTASSAITLNPKHLFKLVIYFLKQTTWAVCKKNNNNNNNSESFPEKVIYISCACSRVGELGWCGGGWGGVVSLPPNSPELSSGDSSGSPPTAGCLSYQSLDKGKLIFKDHYQCPVVKTQATR